MTDLLAAEEALEQAWCTLDAEWHRVMQEAHEAATRIVRQAETDAAHIVRDAHAEAAGIVAETQGEAAAFLLEAHERADRIVAEARAAAEARKPSTALAIPVDDPTGIREALQRLRAELSHVVDAALDAFPAIEATAELFKDAEPAPAVVVEEIDLREPAPVVDLVARPRGLRRLLRRAA